MAFCNYESIRYHNSGLPAGHADDWSLEATLKGLEDFHLAGRSLSKILLTGTFCATIVGASYRWRLSSHPWVCSAGLFIRHP
ncbi:MAG: hypothetical protein NTY37_05290 [Methanothrix sp.]|nr:hypothetical protein [Methanothrix sp.]